MFSKIKNWFNNYWYYYKWTVIIVTAFVAIILLCIFQSSSKENYDVSVIYTGPHMFETGEKQELSNAFQQIMSSDYNGDKKKIVDIIDMPAYTDEQIKAALGDDPADNDVMKYAQYTVDGVRQNFSNAVFVGDVSICLLDKYWYDILYSANGLVKLEDILGYRNEKQIDDYSIYLKDLDIYEFFDAFGKLPPDTIVCFRSFPTTSAFTGKKQAEKMYSYSKKLLCEMFEFSLD